MVLHFQSNLPENDELTEAYQLMRQKLISLKEGEKLTMVGIGQLNNFYELLTSQKDDYSPLSGYDLIKEKVEEVVLMAGLFNENGDKIFFEGNPYITEYNIVTDIKSAKYFIENCPVKITFIDFLAGYKVKSFGNLVAENDMNHPVTFAYHHFSKGPRESWDPLAVYYACLGEKDIFKLSEKGCVTVDETGHTHFHIKEDGLHQYVKLNRKEDEIVDILNQLILLDKGGYK
jgi:inosine-uridine nucleoside N-ribohydrolase